MAVKIRVNKELCSGHARCNVTAPRVYQLDELGYNRMDAFEVPKALEEEARRGARACPEKAIAIIED